MIDSMSVTFLERYQNGDLRAVWLEIQNLRESELDPVTLKDVRAVTLETMQRIKQNLELIVKRLQAIGFEFCAENIDGRFEDQNDPLKPLENASKTLEQISNAVSGPLPLTFRMFAEVIGEVDLRGRHEQFVSGYLIDALVVWIYVPERSEVEDYLEYFHENFTEGEAKYEHAFAPNDFHKENVSGGAPYSIVLPDDRIDPPVVVLGFEGTLIEYLRECILRFACFPGFADIPTDLLEHLRADLVAF